MAPWQADNRAAGKLLGEERRSIIANPGMRKARDFKRRKRIWRVLSSRLMLLALLFVALFLARGAFGVYLKERESAGNLERISEQLRELEAREAYLAERVAKLATPGGLEAEFRRRFPVALPGEKVVVIVDEEAGAGDASAARPETAWEEFFRFFRF